MYDRGFVADFSITYRRSSTRWSQCLGLFTLDRGAFKLSSMVRLITHNLLACHAKGCTSNNFPLAFKDAQVEIREAEFNEDFLRGFMPKIEWDALVNAAREVPNYQPDEFIFFDEVRQLGDASLPEKPPETGAESEEFYKILHHVLMEVNYLLNV